MGSVETVAAVLAEIERRWGHRVVFAARELWHKSTTLPSGINALDDLLGGGIEQGKITALVGRPTSGITTLAYHLISSVHAAGQESVYIDLSQTFNGAYAAACGIDLDRLLVARPPDAVSALNLVRDIATSRVVNFVVLDFEGMGRPAVMLKRLHRRLTATGMALVVTANTALAHTHTRLQVACTGWLYDEADVTGCRIVATLQQHRAQPAGQSAMFDLHFRMMGDRA